MEVLLLGVICLMPSHLKASPTKAVFPGTKWCGAGNAADDDPNTLGIFQGPDSCCRAHDLCPLKIHKFNQDFGLFNPRPYTSLHCSCDEAFRHCLRIEGSQRSRLVGEFYFNTLKAPCFILTKEKSCSKRTWWGRCTKRKDQEGWVAHWQKATNFD